MFSFNRKLMLNFKWPPVAMNFSDKIINGYGFLGIKQYVQSRTYNKKNML